MKWIQVKDETPNNKENVLGFNHKWKTEDYRNKTGTKHLQYYRGEWIDDDGYQLEDEEYPTHFARFETPETGDSLISDVIRCQKNIIISLENCNKWYAQWGEIFSKMDSDTMRKMQESKEYSDNTISISALAKNLA